MPSTVRARRVRRNPDILELLILVTVAWVLIGTAQANQREAEYARSAVAYRAAHPEYTGP